MPYFADVLIFPSEGVVVGDQLKKQGRYSVGAVALQCWSGGCGVNNKSEEVGPFFWHSSGL